MLFSLYFVFSQLDVCVFYNSLGTGFQRVDGGHAPVTSQGRPVLHKECSMIMTKMTFQSTVHPDTVKRPVEEADRQNLWRLNQMTKTQPNADEYVNPSGTPPFSSSSCYKLRAWRGVAPNFFHSNFLSSGTWHIFSFDILSSLISLVLHCLNLPLFFLHS